MEPNQAMLLLDYRASCNFLCFSFTQVSYLSQSGGVVYAQPSQVIGGSPNAVRRITSFRSQSADRKPEGKQLYNCELFFLFNFLSCLKNTKNLTFELLLLNDHFCFLLQCVAVIFSGPGKVGSNFIACLNAKLAPNLSPRTSRRNSEEHGQASKVLKPQQPQRGPGQSFLDSLNAKLAQQHLGGNVVQPVGLKATKVRQIINSKAQVSRHLSNLSVWFSM